MGLNMVTRLACGAHQVVAFDRSPDAVARCEESTVAGAGHDVKMIHNGIEYGLMQAYTEGFELKRRDA